MLPAAYVAMVFRARQKDTESQKRMSATDQPRPALGRRPWFALLRRARSLRRFAFAIRRESVARSGPILTVVDPVSGWSGSPVTAATTIRRRWRGVRGGAEKLLIRTSRVHGRGLREPLIAVGIDGDGGVVASATLQPGRFLHIGGAVWVMELPVGHETPAPGTRLEIYARRRGRNPHPLCNADRQPW